MSIKHHNQERSNIPKLSNIHPFALDEELKNSERKRGKSNVEPKMGKNHSKPKSNLYDECKGWGSPNPKAKGMRKTRSKSLGILPRDG